MAVLAALRVREAYLRVGVLSLTKSLGRLSEALRLNDPRTFDETSIGRRVPSLLFELCAKALLLYIFFNDIHPEETFAVPVSDHT